MTKNITVTDANGDIIGTTYPKRAKGLVKNGRACFAGNDTIRMSASDVSSETLKISEEKSMIYITFKGEEWLRRDVDISYMSNVIDGSVTEALMLGDWSAGEIMAQSRIFMLTPNTDYRFVFWLNGGENESGNETCEFKVAFFSDWENANVYKLNRGFIRPLLHQKGWELYELPFKTPDVEGDVSVTFAFVAGRAPMAVLPALEPSAYADLKDEPDEFEDYRPQRHNIVFKDGWPCITQYGGNKYSTEAIRRKVKEEKAAEAKSFSFGKNKFNFSMSTDGEDDEDDAWSEIEELSDEVEELLDEIESRVDYAEETVEEAEDTLEDISDDIADDEFDSDAFKDKIEGFEKEFNELENEIAYVTGDIDKAYKKLTAVTRHIGRGSTEKAKNELSLIMAEAKKLDGRVYSLESKAESVSDEVREFADSL